MSQKSEEFWNESESYIDTSKLETAYCVLMYRYNEKTESNETKWVPLKEVDRVHSEEGYWCVLSFHESVKK